MQAFAKNQRRCVLASQKGALALPAQQQARRLPAEGPAIAELPIRFPRLFQCLAAASSSFRTSPSSSLLRRCFSAQLPSAASRASAIAPHSRQISHSNRTWQRSSWCGHRIREADASSSPLNGLCQAQHSDGSNTNNNSLRTFPLSGWSTQKGTTIIGTPNKAPCHVR